MKTNKSASYNENDVYIVIVDTNILWDKDKKLPVSGKFDEFWKRNSFLAPIKLCIPDVVFGELHFQQTTSALKALTNAKEQLEDLAGITDHDHSYLFDADKIKDQVCNKLEKWLTSHCGTRIATPIDSIDWQALVDSAIWRKSPFTFDSKDKNNEKGFRDALILETVTNRVFTSSEKEKVIFISQDNLLRNSAKTRLSSYKNFAVFESTEDFEPYIELTRQEQSTNFAMAAQEAARIKFYSAGDSNCIFSKNGIYTKITQSFSKDLIIDESFKSISTGLSHHDSFSVWDLKVNPENWRFERRQINVLETSFVKRNEPDEFHWVTGVSVATLYGNEINDSFQTGASLKISKIQLAKFEAQWKVDITPNGEMKNEKLLGINLKEIIPLEANNANMKEHMRIPESA